MERPVIDAAEQVADLLSWQRTVSRAYSMHCATCAADYKYGDWHEVKHALKRDLRKANKALAGALEVYDSLREGKKVDHLKEAQRKAALATKYARKAQFWAGVAVAFSALSLLLRLLGWHLENGG